MQIVRNSAPVAADDVIEVEDERLAQISLPNDNDDDPDGDRLTLFEYTFPSTGTLTCDPDGGCVYFPEPGNLSDDSFTYTITDGLGGISNTATVEIRVADPPGSPTANPDAFEVARYRTASLDVLGNDTDPDGDLLRIVNWQYPADPAAPASGQVDCTKNEYRRCTYTLDQSYSGPLPLVETFTYEVIDGQPGSTPSEATVTVTVLENRPPTANPDTGSTQGEVVLSIDVLENDTDPDGDTLTITDIVGDPANLGTATCPPTSVGCQYTPPAGLETDGYPITDTFTYVIADAEGLSDSAEIAVTVEAPDAGPVATPNAATLRTGETQTISVLSDDSGIDISIVEFSDPLNGIASCPALDENRGTCSYSPNDGFVGDDSFTYTIRDVNGLEATAEVTITVLDVPDPFVAEDDAVEVSRRQPARIDVLDNDLNPNGGSIRIVDYQPQVPNETATGARVSCDETDARYVPSTSTTGPFPLTDTFTYVATDGRADPVSATVTVTVIDNRAPVATPDSATVRGATFINVLENDRDPDGDPFGFIEPLAGQTENGGSFECDSSTGFCFYEPAELGHDSFTYQVLDDPPGDAIGALSTPTTVTIDVVGNTPRPQATKSSASPTPTRSSSTCSQTIAMLMATRSPWSPTPATPPTGASSVCPATMSACWASPARLRLPGFSSVHRRRQLRLHDRRQPGRQCHGDRERCLRRSAPATHDRCGRPCCWSDDGWQPGDGHRHQLERCDCGRFRWCCGHRGHRGVRHRAHRHRTGGRGG